MSILTSDVRKQLLIRSQKNTVELFRANCKMMNYDKVFCYFFAQWHGLIMQ